MLSDAAQKFIAFVQLDGLLQCPPPPITGALRELESIHSLPHYWFRTCFNVIYLPYLNFSNQKLICMSHFLHTCSMSPSQPINNLVRTWKWRCANRLIWCPLNRLRVFPPKASTVSTVIQNFVAVWHDTGPCPRPQLIHYAGRGLLYCFAVRMNGRRQ